MRVATTLACLAFLLAPQLACGEPIAQQLQMREQKKLFPIQETNAELLQSSSRRMSRGSGRRVGLKTGNVSDTVVAGSVAYDPKSDARKSWILAHMDLKEKDARVDKNTFVQHWKRFPPMAVPAEKQQSYETYLGMLFDAGTAMMLPTKKTDLGKHCFGYASLLVPEFYGDKPRDRLQLAGTERPGDALAALRKELDSDWDGVAKDNDDRVAENAFLEYFLNKYSHLVPSSKTAALETFLKQTFKASLGMMLPKAKSTLGGHCFRYAAVMAGEYYFDSGVRDVLGLAK